jgi:hypothetical protein
LLGAYSKDKDEAMTTAFGARGKKRLNRVFDAIGFVFPDYCYPMRKQGKKRKAATLTTSSVSRSKKVKVLTHRPRHIETADVPKLSEKVVPFTDPGHSMPVEAKTNLTQEPKQENTAEPLKVSSPLCTMELPKPSNIPAVTLRKRRMASVLDVVMESVKTSTPASTEASSTQAKDLRETADANIIHTPAEAGPSENSAEAKPSETAAVTLEKESVSEKFKSPAPEAPVRELEFIVRHASGKQLSKEQVAKVQHYARNLKYPRGSLVYGGNDEDDFLYCLPDNKELLVYREMMDNMGYPKLELGMSAMSKDQLAYNVAYNSLKVCIFVTPQCHLGFLSVLTQEINISCEPN